MYNNGVFHISRTTFFSRFLSYFPHVFSQFWLCVLVRSASVRQFPRVPHKLWSWATLRKIFYTLLNLTFLHKTWSLQGYTLHRFLNAILKLGGINSNVARILISRCRTKFMFHIVEHGQEFIASRVCVCACVWKYWIKMNLPELSFFLRDIGNLSVKYKLQKMVLVW